MNISLQFLLESIFVVVFALLSIAIPFCAYKLTGIGKNNSFINAMKKNKWIPIVSIVCIALAISLSLHVNHLGNQLANSVQY